LLERQFKKTFKEATRSKGVTGELLLQFLERRLDNVVFRLGIAPSRRAARQLVSHKHITVNGQIVNIPSYFCKPGDIIAIREKSKSLEIISDALNKAAHGKYSWLEWDGNQMAGKFNNIPERSEIPEKIEEQLIVELYSK
jgi:small subunit ribosomal protein S4